MTLEFSFIVHFNPISNKAMDFLCRSCLQNCVGPAMLVIIATFVTVFCLGSLSIARAKVDDQNPLLKKLVGVPYDSQINPTHSLTDESSNTNLLRRVIQGFRR
jgi:poly-beta-hydroxyalkanoate depolymerase